MERYPHDSIDTLRRRVADLEACLHEVERQNEELRDQVRSLHEQRARQLTAQEGSRDE